MSAEPKWKVGDPVVIERPSYTNSGPSTVEHLTVDRVARKYFYVGVKGRYDEEGYEIETGIEKPRDPNYTSYLAQAYTPTEYLDKQQRDQLFERISEHTDRRGGKDLININFSWRQRKKWSTNQLRDLLLVLECVLADQPTDRL